jgi:hypothetical protein
MPENGFIRTLKKGKSRAQCFSIGFELCFIQYVKAAHEVVGGKHPSHIGREMLDAPFDHDVVKIPLPLNYSKRML